MSSKPKKRFQHNKHQHNKKPQQNPNLKLDGLKYTPIKFHQGTGYLLDEISSKYLFQKIEGQYNINLDTDFKTPGYKYYKFLKEEDLSSLKNYPHYASLFYGLNPVWCLYLTQIEEINYSFYINFITKEIVFSPHRFEEINYQYDVLLEGEIMYPNTYHIWDILGYKQQPIYKFQTLTQRIEKIRALLNFQYESDHQMDNLKLKIRQIVPFEQIKALTKTDTQHEGIIFLPFNKSTRCYIFRYHKNYLQEVLKTDLELLSIQEVRQAESTSISNLNSNSPIQNFWLSPSTLTDEHDNYLLYEWEGPNTETNLTYFGRAFISTAELSQQIAKVFEITPPNQQYSRNGVSPLIQFRCQYVKKFQKWEPIPQIITNESLDT
jgi:hypothetical protein